MKKLTLLLAVGALALPTLAAAKPPKPPRPVKTPTPAVQAATKNAAWMCKTLRASNASLFKDSFGTNKNKRNAYGKCVSRHARAKHHGGSVSLTNVVLHSTGTVTNGGASGCQFSDAGCTLQSSGTVTGGLTGSYSSTFTVLWKTTGAPNPSVPGGFCAQAGGDTTLTFPGLGTLTKHETGTVCETTATGPNVPHSFNGTFTVTGGTGVFSGAGGSGTVTFDQQPGPSGAQGGTVSGTETFQTLTIKL